MKIWIINHYAVPPTTAGGTRHYYFAKQMIQRGYDVTIIAADYNHFSHTFISSESCNSIDDVPFNWIPTPIYKGNTISRFWNMIVFSVRLLSNKFLPKEKPDIIIGSSPHLFAALGAERLAHKLKVPFILEVRDIWPETLIDLGKFSSYHPLIIMMKWIERYLYKRADKIISLLPGSTDYFVNMGVNKDKIIWLPNAIDKDLIPKNISYKPNKKFTLMYAGAHGLANDLDTVIKAANILEKQGLANKIKISLIGQGPEKIRLKEMTEQNNISMIEFLDPVPKTEIYSVLNKADAFLMLLKKSPLFRWGISPNKLFDYLAMARPVIFGVDTPYNPIQKCDGGITINPSNHEALATAIHQLSLLPESKRIEMGKRGKAYVMEHHYIENLTTILENSIIEVLNSKLTSS